MDDINFNFDNDEILRRILRDHNRPLRKVINNTEKKEIGDRVVVLDYSSASHINGEPLCDDDYEIIPEYHIVIETGNKILFKTYAQDVTIVNPKTNVQFLIASRHLRIYRRF